MSVRESYRSGHQTGFTLVELMVAVALTVILSTTVFGTLFSMQQGYKVQLNYAEAQQNARAVLAVVRDAVRWSGYGFVDDVATQGVVPLGDCFDTGTPANSTFACDNADNGSDRIRVRYGSGTAEAVYQAAWQTQNAGSYIEIQPSLPGHPIAANSLVFVSGTCAGGGATATNIVQITGDTPGANGFSHNYSYTPATGLDCSNFESGFSTGLVTVADFFIDDTTDPDHPRLMRRINAATGGTAQVVAYDIEDLQVQFGIDTNSPKDDVVDVWCDDINDTTACSTGFTTRENALRTTAVRIAVVTRTRTPIPDRVSSGVTVQNHTIPGGDGHRRWIYRTTVALRNN